MRYKVAYKKLAVRDIRKLSPQVKQRIKKKLEYFYNLPDPLETAEPLTKPADAQYRWRVGSYRILFDIEDYTLVILRVQHRRDVYRK